VGNKLDDIVQLPIYGFAQCGNKGKQIIDEYSQEKMPVTVAFVGTSNLENCFFVRAKGNSMEPKIQDGDLVLIRQQASYDESDFVFVLHNQLPKLKKIIKQENRFMLESINRFFDNLCVATSDLDYKRRLTWSVLQHFDSLFIFKNKRVGTNHLTHSHIATKTFCHLSKWRIRKPSQWC